MNKTTLQTVFNRAVKGLAKQNFERAVSASNKCCYFVPETGNRCAIGHCMTPEKAKQAESDGATTYSTATEYLSKAVVTVLHTRDKEYGRLGRVLQQCHDTAHNAQEVVGNLVSFAEVYSLTLPKELQ